MKYTPDIVQAVGDWCHYYPWDTAKKKFGLNRYTIRTIITIYHGYKGTLVRRGLVKPLSQSRNGWLKHIIPPEDISTATIEDRHKYPLRNSFKRKR